MSAFLRSQKQLIGLNNQYRTINSTFRHRFVSYSNYRTKRLSVSPYTTPQISNYNNATNVFASPSCTQIDNLLRPELGGLRYISSSRILYEQPSSKLEVTVQNLKNTQKEKEKGKETDGTVATTQVVPVVHVKKSLQQRIWAECLHYYHGFRLLFIDINVCRKLMWRILNGKNLNRREHRLLVRTTSDLFRLVPFSVFIIVPFMELLLPVAIKLFPGMLPSTFQTATEREDKIKQNLKVKLEMAKFLQKTLDDMAVQSKDKRSDAAKDFYEFFNKVRSEGGDFATGDIIKYSKLFEDEITLDSLTRAQLTALCRVIEVSPIGTSNLLRFQLRMKLRSLAADDRTIQREGVDTLNLSELQAACRARGMRAYGMPEEKLKAQLREWINLSLNEKVPPSLLLLSRAMMIPEHVPTSDKLKATISSLPETIGAQTKAAIAEKEGKIDNKTKIQLIKEEERRIKEEREEEREKQREIAEILVDKAPIVTDDKVLSAETVAVKKELSGQDMQTLEDALDSLSKEKKTLLVEKEEIKDLKEEIADYQEDVKELHEVVTSTPEKVEIKESTAAKLLFKKVNSMISKLDIVMETLEKKEQQIKKTVDAAVDGVPVEKKDELVRIDELMLAITKIQNYPDESKLEQIHTILGRIDHDHDGAVKVENVLKVIETIGKENIKLNAKQVDELVDILSKEEVLEAEEKIEKALLKSLEAKGKQKEMEQRNKDSALGFKEDPKENLIEKESETIRDAEAPIKAKPPMCPPPPIAAATTGSSSTTKTDEPITTAASDTTTTTTDATRLEAAAKNKEKIIPSISISEIPPPHIPAIPVPPPTSNKPASSSSSKML